MEGNTAIVGWESCCMASEPLHIVILLLKQNKNGKFFLEILAECMRILDAWIPNNQEFTDLCVRYYLLVNCCWWLYVLFQPL
jgi:hypothetical protein